MGYTRVTQTMKNTIEDEGFVLVKLKLSTRENVL
jgi:hypothetical protein